MEPDGGYREGVQKRGRGAAKAVLQLNDMLNDIFFRRIDTKDPYWNESAGQLALGICLLLLSLGEKLNMKNLLKWRYEKLADGTLDKCFRNFADGRRDLPKPCGLFGYDGREHKVLHKVNL